MAPLRACERELDGRLRYGHLFWFTVGGCAGFVRKLRVTGRWVCVEGWCFAHAKKGAGCR